MKRKLSFAALLLIICLISVFGAVATACAYSITGLSGTAEDGSVLLSWDEVESADSYTIYWKRSMTGSWKEAGSTSNTRARVKGLSNGVSYDFYIASGEERSSSVRLKPSSGRTGEFGSTEDFVADMGMGINLGNTFDSTGNWFSDTTGQETAWGSPVITKKMIKGYADGGFGVMRLPVSWTVLSDKDGNIPDGFMDRIQQVVDWILDSGMKCILNSHHDGWPEKFTEDYEGTLKIYENVWSQVSERFKDYGEDLMFESMNEVGFDSIWNQYGGTNGKKEAFDMFNGINQKFVDTVRSSGGNNSQRHLLIASYWTGIDHACCDEFKMPDDPADRMAISVHYYTPSTLCILSEDAEWGKARTDWGTAQDYEELNKYMDMMEDNFADKGIPVIIGEYGCFGDNKERSIKEQWTLDVAKAAVERGLCPVLWDTVGDEYDRELAKFRDPDFIEELISLAKD